MPLDKNDLQRLNFKLMRKFTAFFLCFICLLIYLASPLKINSLAFANSIFFQDNFNDGNADGWVIIRNQCGSRWSVEEGRYRNSISGRFCVTEAVPENSLWDNAWGNYSFEVDIRPMTGGDWNLAFRFIDTNNWYGLHFRYDEVILQKVLEGREPAPFPIYYSYPFRPGSIYHIKVIMEDDNIKVFMDDSDTPLIDYTDEETTIRHGKPALQASAGGIPSSSVYFDNVMVKSLDHEDEEEKELVVLVPGHGASWCLSAMLTGNECQTWKATPFVKTYDNLIATFESAGYEQDKNFFIFYYDWRKKIDNLADDFSAFIQDKIPEDEEALLVGHSMGGLVARSYLQKTQDPPVKKLVTVGSPHKGTTLVYYPWEGGQIPSDNTWQWLGLQLFVQLHKKGFATNMETIRHFAPSTQDFLPDFNYLIKNGQEVDVNTMIQQNSWLKNLGSSGPINTFGGNNQETLAMLEVEERSRVDELLGYWDDGKPINKQYSNEGDGTVLLKSAGLNGIPTESLDLNHGAIISDSQGIAKIIQLLELSISEIISDTSLLSRSPALVFFLHSPANLNLKNPPPGTIISNEDKLIIIPSASAGQYELEIIGTGDGFYHLEMGQLTENKDIWQTIINEIKSGEIENIIIDFNPNQPQENILIDPTGDFFLSMAKTKLKELKIDVDKFHVYKSIKARILYQLNKILRYLSPNQTGRTIQRNISYLYQLKISLNQWQKYNLISEDDNIYLKNGLMEVVWYLENAYTRIMEQSGQTVSPTRIQRDLQVINNILNRTESNLKNKTAALTYQLAKEKLNLAQERFDGAEYFSANILNYSTRFLSLEASRI